MEPTLNCRVCRRDIEDRESAVPFKVKGANRFFVHPVCRAALVKSGALVGTAVRGIVEIRRPGFFQQPLVRGIVAAIQELRK